MQLHNTLLKRVILLFSLLFTALPCYSMFDKKFNENATVNFLLQVAQDTPEYLPWQDVFKYMKVKNKQKFSALALVQAAMEAPVADLIQQAALVYAAEKSKKTPQEFFSNIFAGIYLKKGKNRTQKFMCALPTIAHKIPHEELFYFAVPAFSHPSKLLASANTDTASLYCTKTGDIVKKFKLAKKPSKLYFDSESYNLHAKDSEGNLFKTPLKGLPEKFIFNSDTIVHYISPSSGITRNSVNQINPIPSVLSGDGSYRIVSSKEARTIWDTNLDMPITNYPAWETSLLQVNQALNKAALSKDGKLGVTINHAAITIWDLYRMLSPAQFLAVETIRRRMLPSQPLLIPKDSWAGEALKQLDSPARLNLEMRWKASVI
ncbi:MAG: hypothetical protein UV38_C0003G0245 [candidate division TM6 bacterium GW2011_GWE2_42_60]|nr:MAG: hypothetical protein UV38_C0003G0245 [candidate division TM6 bacterium GW2011_GWE2_42_60]HBY05864.1 hypothetical protein [Candidatus Dependentiae bacterium]